MRTAVAAVGDGCRWVAAGSDDVTVVSHAERSRSPAGGRRAQFRYGVVLALTLALVVFVIAAPSANWSRAVSLALEGAALVVAVATARVREEVRHRNALIVGIAMLIATAAVAAGVAGVASTLLVAGGATAGRAGGIFPGG